MITAALFSTASHANTELVINGVSGRLAENIRLLVGEPPAQQNIRQFTRYIDALPEQVISAMSAYGYYSAQASVSVDEIAAPPEKSTTELLVDQVSGVLGANAGDTGTGVAEDEAENSTRPASTITRISISVIANEPVTIRQLDLDIIDLAEDNSDFDAVLSSIRSQLAQGAVFVSSDYEAAKSSLIATAQNLGYFDLEYSEASVAVSRRGKTADITLTAVAGTRFTFGETLFRQRAFSKAFMKRWLPFAPGDPYNAAKVSELTQNLQSSGYFSSVRVRPEINPRYVNIVPLVVDLTERDSNQVAIGLGYSTDTGLRTTLTWDKPLINAYGHSAEWGVSLASKTQSASFSYRIPRLDKPRFNFWGIEYGVKNETDSDNDLDSFLSSLSFQRVSRTDRDWTESFFLRWERERFTADDVEQTTDLVLPGFSYSRTRSEGQPFVTLGQTLSFQLMGGSKRVLSTIDFLKSVGRFRYLRAVTDKNILITTFQLGGIFSDDYDRVPLTQRFFAGGDRTVRGFPFRGIAPTNDDGDAIGGRFLEVGNLEYNYRFRDLWRAAIFIDAGRAFDDYDTPYSVGAGLGLRWQSPVGQFRIDIARPVSDNDGSDWRLHLSLGADV